MFCCMRYHQSVSMTFMNYETFTCFFHDINPSKFTKSYVNLHQLSHRTKSIIYPKPVFTTDVISVVYPKTPFISQQALSNKPRWTQSLEKNAISISLSIQTCLVPKLMTLCVVWRQMDLVQSVVLMSPSQLAILHWLAGNSNSMALVKTCKRKCFSFMFQVLLVVCTGYAWYTSSNEMLSCRFLLNNATTIRNKK